MKEESRTLKTMLVLCLLVAGCFAATQAQTTAFTYQGRLSNGGTPADGHYDFKFTIWDAPSGGVQQPDPNPVTVIKNDVLVTAGTFTVQMNFGVAVFSGSVRFLEIAVRPHSSDPAAVYTTLKLRQQLTSTPYAIRALSAGTADSTVDAQQLGGVAASEYVKTDDARLTDARSPSPGNSNYIQNGTAPQPASDFNVSGNGTAGGTLSGNIVAAATQFNLAGERVLTADTTNLFAGQAAGGANTTGFGNTFVGQNAGAKNLTGDSNAFLGTAAGLENTASHNSFFGSEAGRFSSTGTDNSFFGTQSGYANNTGSNNAFFGSFSGVKNIASGNSFYGTGTGRNNTTGTDNTFMGRASGQENLAGSNNAFFGATAGFQNLASDNSFFGSQTGSSTTSGAGNTFFGRLAGSVNTSGSNNSFFGIQAGNVNTSGSNNTFIGANANASAEDLTNATAIGAGAIVGNSNTMVLGTAATAVQAPGTFTVGTLGTTGATQVCLNSSNQIAGCAATAPANISGDVTGTLSASVVASVAGQSASSINTAVTTVGSATNLNNANAIVRRDGSGNFNAGTIFATTFSGNATTATTATNFSGSLSGNVTGTQGATVVASVGGKTAAQVATSVDDTTNATANNNANAMVKRNASGNFTAGTITASLNGNATTATTATNFSGNLAGDVAGTQGATSIQLNSVTAAKIAAHEVVKNLNGLTDSVTLASDANITITQSGNTLTLSLAAAPLRRTAATITTPGGFQYSFPHALGTLDVIVQVYKQDNLGRWIQIRIGQNGTEGSGFVLVNDVNNCTVGLFEAGTFRIVIIG